VIYGIPLITGMYGQDAIGAVAILVGVITPFYNIAAVIILSFFSETRTGRLSLLPLLRDIARNPLIVGCVAGMAFGALQLEIPPAINKPIDGLSAAASPLALFLMGGEFQFRKLNNNLWKVLSTTAVRLIIVPLAAMLVFVPMGFRSVDLSVLLCIFAAPTAVSSYIMAGSMGCDGELSGQIVVMTTAVSSLSIFLFVFALRSIGFL
jgi:predicted permease